MADQQRGQVRFIRKGGRIIPIHLREGATNVAAGIAVAAGTGAALGGIHRLPAHYKRIAKNLNFELAYRAKRASLFPGWNPNAMARDALAAMSKNKTFSKLAKPQVLAPAFLAGTALSSLLLVRGINRARNKKNQTLPEDIAVTQGASAAAFAVAGATFLRAAGGANSWKSAFKHAVSVGLPSVKRQGLKLWK